MGPLSHEEVVEAMQETLDKNPGAMGMRRETVDFPHDQNVDGSPALLDEDAAQGCRRDGVACTRLQRQATNGGVRA